jgi:hypothetical protein
VYCDGQSAFASYRCPPLRKCAFWNQTASDWDSRGCETLSENGGSLNCACSHLTSFGVVQDTVQYVNSILLSAGELKKEVCRIGKQYSGHSAYYSQAMAVHQSPVIIVHPIQM